MREEKEAKRMREKGAGKLRTHSSFQKSAPVDVSDNISFTIENTNVLTVTDASTAKHQSGFSFSSESI